MHRELHHHLHQVSRLLLDVPRSIQSLIRNLFSKKFVIRVKKVKVSYRRSARFQISSTTNDAGDNDADNGGASADSNGGSTAAPNGGSSDAPNGGSSAGSNGGSTASGGSSDAPNGGSSGAPNGGSSVAPGGSTASPDSDGASADQPNPDSLPDLPEGRESRPGEPCKFSAPDGSSISEIRIRTVFIRGKLEILFIFRSVEISSERQVLKLFLTTVLID